MPRREGPVLAATQPAGVPSAVGFGHAAPDSVGFARGQGVVAAPGEHGAVLTDPLGPRFTSGPGVTAFPVRGEEHRRFDTAARGVLPPVPVTGGDLHGGLR